MAGPNDEIPPEDDALLDEGQDAGSQDDGSGGEAGAGEEVGAQAEEGLEPEAERPQDRRSRRDDTFREELRAIREENARLVQELSNRQQRQQPQEEDDYAFQQRIQLLTQEERMEARLERSNRMHQRQLAALQFQTAEQADKAAYKAAEAANPYFRKYSSRVEQLLQEQRARGVWNLDRATVLRWVMGDAMLANAGKVDQARKAGSERIQRQQARTAPGGAGDRESERSSRSGRGEDQEYKAVLARLSAPDAFI